MTNIEINLAKLIVLLLTALLLSCNKEDVEISESEPELFPSYIFMSLNKEDSASIIKYSDVCAPFHSLILRGGSGSAPDYNYYLECGLGIRDYSILDGGSFSLIYKGTAEDINLFGNMVTLLEKADNEHTEKDPKLMPHFELKYQGETYISTTFDRLYAEFGYTDPNKEEHYSYEIKTPNPSRGCIDHQRVLAIDYQFKGYLYNWEQTDSIYIDSADMRVHTIIYGR